MKLALRGLEFHSRSFDCFQDVSKVSSIFLHALGIYQDIVEVDNAAYVQISFQYSVDPSLKGCRGIGYAEGHNQIFVYAISCAEGCLPFVSLPYPYVVIRVLDVEFGEVLCSLESIQGLADER